MIYHQLPPLNSVKAFETVVREGSISEAARVLFVSQSAVSRHIAKLEAFLDCRLFKRGKSGSVPTEAGKEFYIHISPALNSILEATNKIRATQSGVNIIKVSSLSSFALKWLVPRLKQFQEAHPGIILDLSISDDRPDFEYTQIDCAIVSEVSPLFEEGDDMLFSEQLIVVASPSILSGQIFKDPADIKAFPLIHTKTRIELWKEWCTEYEVDNTHGSFAGLNFQDFYISIAACISGNGIALVPSFLVRQELTDGSLVQPVPQTLLSGKKYRFVTPQLKRQNKSVIALRDWLMHETKNENL
ncbi:LysR family transcriptional regulator [Cocleimonas flava]|uniref:LysR family transcriptional regulator n=1 Tax=Cocleimonas flava TaxID=634765 RepID=A0A4R1F5U9_9GAMM|nr:LysR substrate-binding domain-containing protein [Cocleimonas flava]TCJ88850.1 LysR family transcriptional regulator [Cocleimonas flava]